MVNTDGPSIGLLLIGCLVVLVVGAVLLVLLVRALMGGRRNPPGSGQGPYQPQYNDPNITSDGSFGGGAAGGPGQGPSQPQYNDPNITSGGSFGDGSTGAGSNPPAYGGFSGAPSGRGFVPDTPSGNTANTPPTSAPDFGGAGFNPDSAGNPPEQGGTGRGDNRPRHDDPNITSGGSFGG